MIRYDHYTDKFVKVSDRECPWCKAVCASTDKYCHECGWHIADTPQTDCDKCIWSVCNYNKVDWDDDTPLTEDEYFLELMDAVMRGEMSDAEANQAWYEYINKQDTPQTDCGWGEPNE